MTTDYSLEEFYRRGEAYEMQRDDEAPVEAVLRRDDIPEEPVSDLAAALMMALYGGAAVGFAAVLWWVGDKLAGLLISGGW